MGKFTECFIKSGEYFRIRGFLMGRLDKDYIILRAITDETHDSVAISKEIGTSGVFYYISRNMPLGNFRPLSRLEILLYG